MPRNVAYRRTYSDVTCASQAFAANATMYILRQTGPTGFLLKEEGEAKDFKVFLGDPHSCTCPAFRKEKDLCKHICWVLLKKFRLDKDNPLSWQMGLSDIEMDEVMRGPRTTHQSQRQRAQASVPRQVADASGGRPLVAQREIADDDVCPICQDEFMDKKLPVTYCKFSCGNNIHIKCMKVWAEHQLSQSKDQTIKCPMCREDFGPVTLLKQEMRNAAGPAAQPASSNSTVNSNSLERHVGIGCSNCRMAPIEGKCYRCCICADFYLCQACFNTPAHTHHSFQFRQKRNQRWRNAQRMLGAALPDAIVNDLMNREISASDYDTLLQLDNQVSSAAGPLSDLTEETLQMLPMERAREGGALMAPGVQCRVCLRGYKAGQFVRKLPCQHKFHKDCIDGWLLHSRPTCPIDSQPVFTTRPRSDTGNRQRNRPSALSAGSQPAGDGLLGGGGEGRSSSISVPALGISSMRLGHSEDNEGRREVGDRGVLARRPPRDVHVPHHPPTRLELTGTRVGAEDTSNVRSDLTGPGLLPPGSQLLQQAIERRSHLNQHLTRLLLEANGAESEQPSLAGQLPPFPASVTSTRSAHVSPTTADYGAGAAEPHAHFDFNVASERRHSGSSRRTASNNRIHNTIRQQRVSRAKAAPLRQRSSSQERTPASVQSLYLGNDPRQQRPPEGEVSVLPADSRGPGPPVLHHRSPHAQRPRPPRRHGASLVMEGSGMLDHLTLRDIL